MYQNDPMKVLTGEVRLSYANLTTPRAAKPGGEAKYSVTLLIPKSDTQLFPKLFGPPITRVTRSSPFGM